MFDKKKFKMKVLEQDKTLHEVAEYLGIDSTTLWRKMNGKSDFFRDEIRKLTEYLELENPQEIFFAEKIT
ncbi:hypothetical protein [Robinsoniella peoriensis]